jgi:SPX domain protein involved in polyphosphate accumulation
LSLKIQEETGMHTQTTTIRTFNRFELKYILDLKQAEKFKSGLRAYMVPDEHGNNNGRYMLSSLYYDSPNFACYHEKVDGLRFRRKLRLRIYETDGMLTEESPVFLEIKQRVDRVTQKRRAVMTYGNALRLCNDRVLPGEVSPEDRDVVDEIYVFLWQYNLQPASIVHYERQAFTGTDFDPGLRITFDTSLSFQAYPLHLHELDSSLPMMSENQVVLEIKVNERVPIWLTDLIKVHALQLIRISKYCRSIEAAQYMPGMQARRLMSERSQEVLSSSVSNFSMLQEEMGIRR